MPGCYFEEFSVGQVFEHAFRRTVTEMDNVLFSALTHNPSPLHFDEEYCRNGTEPAHRVVNSAFTLGLIIGVTLQDTTLGTSAGNLGWNDVRFPQPLLHGDTVHVRTTIADLSETTSRPGTGITTFLHEAFNQRNELVATCRRTVLVKKKSSA